MNFCCVLPPPNEPLMSMGSMVVQLVWSMRDRATKRDSQRPDDVISERCAPTVDERVTAWKAIGTAAPQRRRISDLYCHAPLQMPPALYEFLMTASLQ